MQPRTTVTGANSQLSALNARKTADHRPEVESRRLTRISGVCPATCPNRGATVVDDVFNDDEDDTDEGEGEAETS